MAFKNPFKNYYAIYYQSEQNSMHGYIVFWSWKWELLDSGNCAKEISECHNTGNVIIVGISRI